MSKYLKRIGHLLFLCILFQTSLWGQTNSIGKKDIVSGEVWKDTDEM